MTGKLHNMYVRKYMYYEMQSKAARFGREKMERGEGNGNFGCRENGKRGIGKESAKFPIQTK